LAESEGVSMYVMAWSALTVCYGYKSQDVEARATAAGYNYVSRRKWAESRRCIDVVDRCFDEMADRETAISNANEWRRRRWAAAASRVRSVGRRLRVLFPVYLPPALPWPAAARVVPGTAHCSARSPGARARQRGGWSFHGDATLLSFDAWNSTSGDRRREDVGQQLSSG